MADFIWTTWEICVKMGSRLGGNTMQNIIFDVGDVLLEYRWKDMLVEDYGMTEERAVQIGKSMFDDPLWSGLDLGNPLEETICRYEKKYPEYAKEIRWFLTHGEKMHVKRPEVWEKVHELKKAGYGIYLLSNYSEDLFNKHTKGASFLDDIDGKVVSYEIQKIKPDPQIYLYLLEKYQLNAEECLFFDDREQNTEGAEKVGIPAITVCSQKQLLMELEKILCGNK